VVSVSAAAAAEDAVAAADNAAEAFRAWAVRRVNFTGSTPVVLGDADLDYAARAAAFGAFANNGQACMAANRIIVQRSVGDAFVERLCAQVAALRCGGPRDPQTQIGPLADPAAPARARALVRDARSHGASVAAGGTSTGAVTPTVLTGVSAEIKVYHEEIFGPVAPVTFVDSAEEAVANDTAFGLSAGVLTSDHVPFGGVGDSGYERFGGTASIHEFTELRWTTVQRQTRKFHL
jgi:acyl-CoA reductase-like NAD-dependent aldehyde dehydrogenase